jgi:hypothetical protein
MSVLVPWSILLPVAIGLFKFKVLPKNARIIWYYLLVSAIVNFSASFIGRTLHLNNLPLIHIYTAIEGVMFCWYYKTTLQAAKNSFLFLLLPVLFVLFCIINALFFQSIYTYSSYSRSLEAIMCILFALNYFARMATTNNNKKIISLPAFHFNAGIFLYFSGAFMLFVFSNFIFNLSDPDYYIIWVIHAGFVLCMYLFFSAAFLLCKK